MNDVVQESLSRLEIIQDDGIYLSLATPEQLSQSIQDIGTIDLEDKPLWGIPFAVKDNIDVKDMTTTAACSAFAYVANEDAYVIQLLKSAGAIVIGKTNLDQFATGLVGMRTPFPAPRNAIDAQFVPGGSSSGSAVAVSHGQVCFSLGTDTAGSGRVPAALNNIIGLKPSLGSVSNRGVFPACRSLDTVSIFALSMADATRVFSACRQYDDADPYSRTYTPYSRTYNKALDSHSDTPLTIAIPCKASLIFDEESQQLAFEQAMFYWSENGSSIVEIDFEPFYDVAKLLYEGPWVAERLSALSPFLSEHENALHPVTEAIIQSAHRFSACDLFDALFRLKTLKRDILKKLEYIDVICVPSIPGFVTRADIENDPISPNSRLGTYTNFVNLLDFCAITVPGALRHDHYPSSITLIAENGKDTFIHELATIFHASQAEYFGATQCPVS